MQSYIIHITLSDRERDLWHVHLFTVSSILIYTQEWRIAEVHALLVLDLFKIFLNDQILRHFLDLQINDLPLPG